MKKKEEETHPVTGNDLSTVVHQGGGIQLLSCLVEANAIPDIHRRHHTLFTPVTAAETQEFRRRRSVTDSSGSTLTTSTDLSLST